MNQQSLDRLPVKWGLELIFEKGDKQIPRLYCALPTQGAAERYLETIQDRLVRDRQITFGWARLVFEQDWLFRNMPRKSVLVGINIRELYGPQ